MNSFSTVLDLTSTWRADSHFYLLELDKAVEKESFQVSRHMRNRPPNPTVSQNQVEVRHDGKQKVASKSQSDKSHKHVTWQVQHQNQGIQKSS